ncbi:MAG: DUF1287 domain-containing protein [Bacilli bacterium]
MAKRKIKKKFKKKVKTLSLVVVILVLLVLSAGAIKYYSVYSEDLTPIDEKKEYYNISDFGFVRKQSKTDYDKDGIDDYTEYLNGEKQYAKWNPSYISEYYAGGYPEVEKEGVCTDVIWYALKTAGYDLKKLIDKDIEETYKKGTYNIEIVDQNIDFRRVINQEVFFQRYAESLNTDFYSIGDFMPGDIITFDDSAHIAMISDKYNINGVPYVIQNRDETQKQKEEDRLEKTEMKVTGHYRFTYTDKIENLINKIK